eukprot:gene6903-11098_t
MLLTASSARAASASLIACSLGARKADTAPPSLPLAYGGILAAFDKTDSSSRTDFQEAIKHGKDHVQHALQRCFSPRLDDNMIVTVTSKHTLKHTEDKRPPYTPHVTTVYNHQRNSKQRRAVILGINYHFDLEWPVRASGIAGYGPQVRFVYHRLTVTRDRNGQYHVLSHVAGVRSASTRTTSFASSASAVVMQDSVWSIVDGGTGSSAAVAAAPRALLDRYSLDKMPAPTGRVAHLGGRQHCEGSTGTTDALQRRKQPLRVLTYNVWNVNAHLYSVVLSGLEAALLLVHSTVFEDPDIVAFQEVRHDSERDSQVETLAKLLPGYELLPKNPEDNGDVHQRALLQVEISTHLGGFHALVTHLALSEMARDLSVLKIWLRIQQIQRDKDGATVALMGDLNAEPLETAMQFLVGNQTLVDPVTGSNITMTGMVDAWTSLHPNEDGHTFNMLDVSDPKKGLKKRIDYIIMKPWKRVQLGEVATIPRAFKPDDPPASDHLGVIMLLERK